jgi:hypothetical protein
MRRVTAAIAVGVVAAFGMLAIAPSAMADGPAAAKADTVAAALGVKPVRAEIAVLVDHSVSMSAGKNNDLYPGITSELPIILDTLARQQPQDTVVLIKFAASAQLVYDGAAKAGLAGMLPATATAGGNPDNRAEHNRERYPGRRRAVAFRRRARGDRRHSVRVLR